ncbi:DUF3566 domain-containing protein [Mycobacterium sp. 21AC1]|uniref:DUF3566 domain-containing protein n=1 Tax=[Mycobacterium] appelbergii TaxID=2939269 RepID=UPI0029391429|nr:DUF3566 domain-containing protein [Mycobacterium sp. 21AC1]MDV3123378.1 DUF3566 domain-containing protein [Mycobacterium sp. 21AC1]
MTSPSEPGFPRAGDRSGSSNGSGSGNDGTAAAGARPTGHITETGEPPPWQRGTAARNASAPSEQRPDTPRGPGGHASGDGRGQQRFVAGSDGEVEPPRQRPDSGRPESARPEAYASELPDLSGPVPRSPQRKPSGNPEPAAARSSSPTTRIQVAANRSTGALRASMQIRRVDPWTVLKVSLVLSAALFFVWMIAVAFLYLVLGGMGVWSKLNSNVGDLLTSSGGNAGGELVSSGTIFGGAALIGLVNIVVLTAMATIGAFIYNLTTDLVGGVEVTLADRD